ncbi:hypothetical protein ABMA27_003171 [Loxostege sticticalis]|uniref:Uncharacterized protein n=1 Tax=Loxostege sticticalis TaxID=481309 RepID=A0ABR3HS70_LOXSC
MLLPFVTHARISVMYAHDKLSDIVAEQCFNEMFPKTKHVEVQESDEPCLIFCVMKKLGIMSPNGAINLETYRKRVLMAHQHDQRTLVSDFGSSCVENAEATQHKQDVCKKAKVFNDCTHLYRILFVAIHADDKKKNIEENTAPEKHKTGIGLGKMLAANILLCTLPCVLAMRPRTSAGTLVDFTDPKVQGHLDALVRLGQSCVIKVRATPKDVRAYFTNSSPVSRSGQCFAACMLEQSDIINHGKVNRDLLVHQASLVNGKNSRVVRKLNSISRLCLDSIEGMSDRCQLASTYNDCLNENMLEFAFPLDIAEEAVRKMPFHLIQPK